MAAAYDTRAASLLPARHRAQPGGTPGCGARRRLARGRALALEAGLQRFHQVHHLRRPPLLGRGRDVLALELLLDELLDALADLVLVLLGMEGLARDLLDELPGQLHLRLRVAPRRDAHLLDVADLVGVVVLVHEDPLPVAADDHDIAVA